MQKILEIVILIVGGLLASVVTALVSAFFFMLAWNYAVPAVFGLPEVDFWKSFALLVVVGFVTPKATATSPSK